MFTDQKEALEAEALGLTPLDSDQSTAASAVIAHHARDKDDLADLLHALGLPGGEDDLERLLPQLTTPAPLIDNPGTSLHARSPPPPAPASRGSTGSPNGTDSRRSWPSGRGRLRCRCRSPDGVLERSLGWSGGFAAAAHILLQGANPDPADSQNVIPLRP